MIVGTVNVFLIKNFEEKTSSQGKKVYVGLGLYENPIATPGLVKEVLIRLYSYDAKVFDIFGETNYQNRLIAFSGIYRQYIIDDNDTGSDLENASEPPRRYEMDVRDWQIVTKHEKTINLPTSRSAPEDNGGDPPVNNDNCKPDGNG